MSVLAPNVPVDVNDDAILFFIWKSEDENVAVVGNAGYGSDVVGYSVSEDFIFQKADEYVGFYNLLDDATGKHRVVRSIDFKPIVLVVESNFAAVAHCDVKHIVGDIVYC